MSATVTLAASADAEVKLSYQIIGPGWTPTYRALLDTATRKVRIEQQAMVVQTTGEDWRGVKLVLSTGQPCRETTGHRAHGASASSRHSSSVHRPAWPLPRSRHRSRPLHRLPASPPWSAARRCAT